VLAEYDTDRHVVCVKTAKVDDKKIKADTWYMLKGKKFVLARQPGEGE
jgi:translation initiation factor 2 beta subunit (eIF-2beta)/eIF-5